jgi:hypothetical protein
MPKDDALSPAICIDTKKVGVLCYVDSVSSAAKELLIEFPEQGKGREWRAAMTMIHDCLASKCKPRRRAQHSSRRRRPQTPSCARVTSGVGRPT